MAVRKLNHAVLWVRDAERSAEFYARVLGFEVTASGRGAVFMRAAESSNDHDLGLFSVGATAAAGLPGARSVGLYHLAWQVATIDELVRLHRVLSDRGSLVGMSDHGVSKSLYAVDPDGIEFEVMWATPPSEWATFNGGLVAPLDLPAEQARWSGIET